MSRPQRYSPLALAERLIRCRSITPDEGGALGIVGERLKRLGFVCNRVNFDGIDNLFAFLSGGDGEHFSFCGHVDVVPPAEESAWSHPPFAAESCGGSLYGRGAVDMKGAVACFVAAAAGFIRRNKARFGGSVSIMLTADEEGDAENGIRRLMEWLAERGKLPDICLVGEPTCARVLGDQMRIGRRGSLRLKFKVVGRAGHSAWPERADNPIPRITALLDDFTRMPLGGGDENFPADTAVVTQVHADGEAANVIPQVAVAAANIRFGGGEANGRQLANRVETHLRRLGHKFAMKAQYNAEPFICENQRLISLIREAVFKHTEKLPEPSCGGGTSDARFIAAYCPVAEFGLVGQTMHKVDENCSIADLQTLVKIYEAILTDFFA